MMKQMTKPIAVFLLGPPGAGKGTQADLLARDLGLVHIDTGRLLQEILFDPLRQDDARIQFERQLFESGILNSPEWVREVIMKKAAEIARHQKGIVFSGSPRTLFEAEGLVPLLEELYGKENLIVFLIKIPAETSIFRNSHRRICENFHPLVWSEENEKLTTCPQCGAKLVSRGSLDSEEAIRKRLLQYESRTKPVIEFLRERGIGVYEIDGENSPEIVHQDISKVLQKRQLLTSYAYH